MDFVSEVCFVKPAGILAGNLAMPVIHALAAAFEFKILPLTADILLPIIHSKMPQLDYIRIAWAGVAFAVFLHWIIFVLYAEVVCLSGYSASAPREDNEEKKSKLAKRLYGAHQNALEFLCYFGLAVACASALGVVTAGGTTAECKEVATLAVVATIARIAHVSFYVADLAFFRAVAYAVGFHCSLYIFAGSLFGFWTSDLMGLIGWA